MDTTDIRVKRRRFLRFSAAVVAFVPGSGALFAQPMSSRVDAGEDKARNLGYRDDATQVDRAKFTKYEPGQICGTCQFYKGADGEPSGPCQIFKGRQVSAKGWCMSWWKKAGMTG